MIHTNENFYHYIQTLSEHRSKTFCTDPVQILYQSEHQGACLKVIEIIIGALIFMSTRTQTKNAI